jgi:hypothetical protein
MSDHSFDHILEENKGGGEEGAACEVDEIWSPRTGQQRTVKDLNLALWPKQYEVWTSLANIICFGGGIGSGKSYLMRVLLISYCYLISHVQAFLFRREYLQIRDTHFRGPTSFQVLCQPLMEAGLCKVNPGLMTVAFANGSFITGAHSQYEEDADKFYGSEMHILAIDELNSFTEYIWRTLSQRCRLGSFKVPDQFKHKFPLTLCSASPQGCGVDLCRRQFVDVCDPPGKVIELPGGDRKQYIHATVDDNPSMESGYKDRVMREYDPVQAKALLLGDWSHIVGSYFGDVWDKSRHVIGDFVVPGHWRLWMGMDDASKSPAAVLWLARDPANDRFFVLDELWVQDPADPILLAKKILARSYEVCSRSNHSGWPIRGWLDSSAFASVGNLAPARGDIFNRYGCSFAPVPKGPLSRVHGWQYIHSLLETASDGKPALLICARCTMLIRALPGVPRDLKDVEDIDTNYRLDHVLDALNYALSHRRDSAGRVRLTNI